MTVFPSKKFISVGRVWIFIAMILAAFLCGIISVFSPTAAAISGVVLLAALLIIALWYLPRYYRSYEITASDKAVCIRRGVFLHRKYILPCPRLIYAELVITPIDRIFHVQTIHIHAVRGLLSVHCLEPADAELLMSLVSRQKDGGCD